MILVDSSVWIDYFRGTTTPQAEKLDSLLGFELIATGDLILTEVLQGFVSERDFTSKVSPRGKWQFKGSKTTNLKTPNLCNVIMPCVPTQLYIRANHVALDSIF